MEHNASFHLYRRLSRRNSWEKGLLSRLDACWGSQRLERRASLPSKLGQGRSSNRPGSLSSLPSTNHTTWLCLSSTRRRRIADSPSSFHAFPQLALVKTPSPPSLPTQLLCQLPPPPLNHVPPPARPPFDFLNPWANSLPPSPTPLSGQHSTVSPSTPPTPPKPSQQASLLPPSSPNNLSSTPATTRPTRTSRRRTRTLPPRTEKERRRSTGRLPTIGGWRGRGS